VAATHLRLTMAYPSAKILGTVIEHKDENMTVRNESEGNSVVAFLPRLAPAASISISVKINGTSTGLIPGVIMDIPQDILNKADYSDDSYLYMYFHNLPYSIVATYDQGSAKYSIPNLNGFIPTPVYQYVSEGLLPIVLIILAFLSFGIAIRRRRRSNSRFASNILTDLINVRDNLNDNSSTNLCWKILRLHTWQANIDHKHEIIRDFRDYQKIDDFYTAVNSRDSYLLQNQVNEDILKILNKQCIDQATIAYEGIDWRNFHKLDIVLLIPTVILGSFFITYLDLFYFSFPG
jgi:hypothetical protein